MLFRYNSLNPGCILAIIDMRPTRVTFRPIVYEELGLPSPGESQPLSFPSGYNYSPSYPFAENHYQFDDNDKHTVQKRRRLKARSRITETVAAIALRREAKRGLVQRTANTEEQKNDQPDEEVNETPADQQNDYFPLSPEVSEEVHQNTTEPDTDDSDSSESSTVVSCYSAYHLFSSSSDSQAEDTAHQPIPPSHIYAHSRTNSTSSRASSFTASTLIHDTNFETSSQQIANWNSGNQGHVHMNRSHSVPALLPSYPKHILADRTLGLAPFNRIFNEMPAFVEHPVPKETTHLPNPFANPQQLLEFRSKIIDPTITEVPASNNFQTAFEQIADRCRPDKLSTSLVIVYFSSLIVDSFTNPFVLAEIVHFYEQISFSYEEEIDLEKMIREAAANTRSDDLSSTNSDPVNTPFTKFSSSPSDPFSLPRAVESLCPDSSWWRLRAVNSTLSKQADNIMYLSILWSEILWTLTVTIPKLREIQKAKTPLLVKTTEREKMMFDLLMTEYIFIPDDFTFDSLESAVLDPNTPHFLPEDTLFFPGPDFISPLVPTRLRIRPRPVHSEFPIISPLSTQFLLLMSIPPYSFVDRRSMRKLALQCVFECVTILMRLNKPINSKVDDKSLRWLRAADGTSAYHSLEMLLKADELERSSFSMQLALRTISQPVPSPLLTAIFPTFFSNVIAFSHESPSNFEFTFSSLLFLISPSSPYATTRITPHSLQLPPLIKGLLILEVVKNTFKSNVPLVLRKRFFWTVLHELCLSLREDRLKPPKEQSDDQPTPESVMSPSPTVTYQVALNSNQQPFWITNRMDDVEDEIRISTPDNPSENTVEQVRPLKKKKAGTVDENDPASMTETDTDFSSSESSTDSSLSGSEDEDDDEDDDESALAARHLNSAERAAFFHWSAAVALIQCLFPDTDEWCLDPQQASGDWRRIAENLQDMSHRETWTVSDSEESDTLGSAMMGLINETEGPHFLQCPAKMKPVAFPFDHTTRPQAPLHQYKNLRPQTAPLQSNQQPELASRSFTTFASILSLALSTIQSLFDHDNIGSWATIPRVVWCRFTEWNSGEMDTSQFLSRVVQSLFLGVCGGSDGRSLEDAMNNAYLYIDDPLDPPAAIISRQKQQFKVNKQAYVSRMNTYSLAHPARFTQSPPNIISPSFGYPPQIPLVSDIVFPGTVGMLHSSATLSSYSIFSFSESFGPLVRPSFLSSLFFSLIFPAQSPHILNTHINHYVRLRKQESHTDDEDQPRPSSNLTRNYASSTNNVILPAPVLSFQYPFPSIPVERTIDPSSPNSASAAKYSSAYTLTAYQQYFVDDLDAQSFIQESLGILSPISLAQSKRLPATTLTRTLFQHVSSCFMSNHRSMKHRATQAKVQFEQFLVENQNLILRERGLEMLEEEFRQLKDDVVESRRRRVQESIEAIKSIPHDVRTSLKKKKKDKDQQVTVTVPLNGVILTAGLPPTEQQIIQKTVFKIAEDSVQDDVNVPDSGQGADEPPTLLQTTITLPSKQKKDKKAQSDSSLLDTTPPAPSPPPAVQPSNQTPPLASPSQPLATLPKYLQQMDLLDPLPEQHQRECDILVTKLTQIQLEEAAIADLRRKVLALHPANASEKFLVICLTELLNAFFPSSTAQQLHHPRLIDALMLQEQKWSELDDDDDTVVWMDDLPQRGQFLFESRRWKNVVMSIRSHSFFARKYGESEQDLLEEYRIDLPSSGAQIEKPPLEKPSSARDSPPLPNIPHSLSENAFGSLGAPSLATAKTTSRPPLPLYRPTVHAAYPPPPVKFTKKKKTEEIEQTEQSLPTDEKGERKDEIDPNAFIFDDGFDFGDSEWEFPDAIFPEPVPPSEVPTQPTPSESDVNVVDEQGRHSAAPHLPWHPRLRVPSSDQIAFSDPPSSNLAHVPVSDSLQNNSFCPFAIHSQRRWFSLTELAFLFDDSIRQFAEIVTETDPDFATQFIPAHVPKEEDDDSLSLSTDDSSDEDEAFYAQLDSSGASSQRHPILQNMPRLLEDDEFYSRFVGKRRGFTPHSVGTAAYHLIIAHTICQYAKLLFSVIHIRILQQVVSDTLSIIVPLNPDNSRSLLEDETLRFGILDSAYALRALFWFISEVVDTKEASFSELFQFEGDRPP
ncbi:hypothetical protein BLNAU_4687 [Blattamonas nauphoetae]|uniref:Uncharacterized protein n=1 Tax=Blattamonas nauphoetae TaxID=2049346 RepID=A0ABQ9Y9U9_9EUKA|nr:hypothetical protein BLNAU_4687 [Blattamonas nauphoetae]